MPEENKDRIVHTLRIELLNDRVLLYRMNPEAKEELENLLHLGSTEEEHNVNFDYIRFNAIPERYVYIRSSCVSRLIFCWDVTDLTIDPHEYYDHFEVTTKIESETLIPDAILLMRGNTQPLVFSDIDTDNGIFETDSDFNLSGLTFIRIEDEDGEDNYIPTENIDLLEIKKSIIYPEV